LLRGDKCPIVLRAVIHVVGIVSIAKLRNYQYTWQQWINYWRGP